MKDHAGRRGWCTPSGVLVPAYIDPFHQMLHHVAPAGLTGHHRQTSGMTRVEAISGKTVGTRACGWARRTCRPRPPATTTTGESETAIYVVRGHPVFVFLPWRATAPT